MSNDAEDHPPKLKRKREPSMTLGAERARRFRRRRKRGIHVASLQREVTERDIDMFSAAGHLDERLERDDPAAAIAAALNALLDAILPSAKMKRR